MSTIISQVIIRDGTYLSVCLKMGRPTNGPFAFPHLMRDTGLPYKNDFLYIYYLNSMVIIIKYLLL